MHIRNKTTKNSIVSCGHTSKEGYFACISGQIQRPTEESPETPYKSQILCMTKKQLEGLYENIRVMLEYEEKKALTHEQRLQAQAVVDQVN